VSLCNLQIKQELILPSGSWPLLLTIPALNTSSGVRSMSRPEVEAASLLFQALAYTNLKTEISPNCDT
jgi:hypothetical protein